jgi:hypothetical protein
MPEPGFARIIHPASGNIAEVPQSSLRQHYAAGWAPLDESPEPETEPAPTPDTPDTPPVPVRPPAYEPDTSTDYEESN